MINIVRKKTILTLSFPESPEFWDEEGNTIYKTQTNMLFSVKTKRIFLL